MKHKQLLEQLNVLKMTYEDAVIRKARVDEVKKILQAIDEVNKQIAVIARDRLH